MKYLSLGTRLYLTQAIAFSGIPRAAVAFSPSNNNIGGPLQSSARTLHSTKNRALFMVDPSYVMRKTMFGIEDDKVLKDVVTSNENVCFVDVRNPDEIEESWCRKPFVAGKFLLDDDEACDEEVVSKALPDKDAPHIVFCAKGGRAKKACQNLKSRGYTKVFNAGGVGDLDLFLE